MHPGQFLYFRILLFQKIRIRSVFRERFHNALPQQAEELIRRYGEKYFRGVEARSILEVSSLRHTVIACGGGAVLSAENRRALRRNGIVVYLQRDLESLCTRGRPLSPSREGLEKLYEQAASGE